MIRLLQLERRGDGFAVSAAGACALPPDVTPTHAEFHHATGQTILKLIGAGGFVGADVVSCIPAEKVQYKNLRLPAMPADELKAAVQWEAAERLSKVGKQSITQFFHAGEVRQGEDLREEIILMAAPTDFVEAHVEMLTRCGLRAHALDVVPGALARVMLRIGGDPDAIDVQTRVAIDIGWGATKVLILHGRRIVFFKLLEIGGKHFDHAIADHLGVSEGEARALRHRTQNPVMEGAEAGSTPAEDERIERALLSSLRPIASELGREISLCLRYYSVTFRGPRPDGAMLLGGEITRPGLIELLSDSAGIAMHLGDPLSSFDCSAVDRMFRGEADRAAWAVAAGLSLRETGNPARRPRLEGRTAA
jgi:type IV pilus assembly protein PilM